MNKTFIEHTAIYIGFQYLCLFKPLSIVAMYTHAMLLQSTINLHKFISLPPMHTIKRTKIIATAVDN